MPAEVVGMMGTVVTLQDELEILLVLCTPVILLGMACWSIWRWRKRWWGWPLAVGSVVCLGILSAWFLEDREERINLSRGVETEFELMTLRSRLRTTRLSIDRTMTADVETLVKAMLSNVTSPFRDRTNDRGEIVDLWGHPLRIELGSEIGDIEVRSAGADGEFGTVDDLPSKE